MKRRTVKDSFAEGTIPRQLVAAAVAEISERAERRYMRLRALPGGGTDTECVQGCECGERRGPAGGVCGNCGCAIPGSDDGGAISLREAVRKWRESSPHDGRLRGILWRL